MKPKCHSIRLYAFVAFVFFQIIFLFRGFSDTVAGKIDSIPGYGQTPLRFEANSGQADSQVRYISRGNGYAMCFSKTEIDMALDVSTNANLIRHRLLVTTNQPKKQLGFVKLKFKDANTNALIFADQTLPEKINYIISNEPTNWHTGISAFRRVHYQNIYPGVDLVFYGNQGHLEYDFEVAPHSDPKLVKLELVGAKSVTIESNGDLAFSIGGRTSRFNKPIVYQTLNGIRHEIGGRYNLNDNSVGFEIESYNPALPLVIDPVLSYSTFLGGTKGDVGYGIVVDSGGNAYVCGNTFSTAGLATTGAFQTSFGGGKLTGDGFVAKIDSSGTNLIYFTYLGGSDNDSLARIALDKEGNAYLSGWTESTDFPTTANALYPNFIGHHNTGKSCSFITKLNSSGSGLLYSTYFGGSSFDVSCGIVVDSLDNIYIAGETSSPDFPTKNAVQSHQAANDGAYEGFVTEVASNGISLIFSTFYGGKASTYVEGISIDSSNSVYICGLTSSTNFPVTNAVQSKYGGGDFDAFAFKLGPFGTNIIYSTYLGGKSLDEGYGIGIDTNGNAYIAGLTFSTNFPNTNALQKILNGNNNTNVSDAFVTKLSPSGQLIYSSYLGGSNTDIAYDVKVERDGEMVVVGQTGSIDFAPYNNYGSVNSGNLDAFVAKLSPDGNVLMNFAYLGGTSQDEANGVALDNDENAYVIGATWSFNFPISSANVVDPTFGFNNTNDAFIVKLYFEPNQLGTEVVTSWQDPKTGSVIGAPASLADSNSWAGVAQIASISSNGVTSLINSRLQRGLSYDPTYTSFIIPLNQQTGFRLDDLGNNSENFGGNWPWFTRLQSDVRTHLSLFASTNILGISTNYYGYVTNFNNPIAAFGAISGESTMYLSQQYKFGVYCGAQYESTNSSGTNFAAPLRILVYNLSSFVSGQTNLIAPIATNYITLPRRTIAADSTNWLKFATNGFSLTIETNGLRTTVQLVMGSSGAWGVATQFTNAQNGTYIITHECLTNQGYGYVLEGIGAVPLYTNLYPMVTNSVGAVGWDRLYSLDFQARPPWRSVFIDQPQFSGQPLPSFYQGASLSELTNLNAIITNTIPLTDSAYSLVDDSPELRRHPLLDKVVANLNNDPVAIANMVVNQIELTDALAYNNDNGEASAPTVNEGGVNRSALDVYLEGQGSPMEQCALLVYLLRQAGYPAAYVFPTNNNVLMLDTRLSAILRMQLHGAVNQYGQTYTTNALITVNYPWVVTSISNQTIHIFPWIKDTQITEGLNLYDYMPTNYDNGFKWLSHYLYGDTNILALSMESDAPSVLFPRFIKQQLLKNAPGVSLDDIGLQAFNRQHYYSRWQDFPTPSVVNNSDQVACADSLTTITNVLPGMSNIFNTVTLTIFSQNNTNTQLTVGPLRMADIHNREMFLATNGANGLMLWLAPYIASNTNQSSFDLTDPALTNKQVAILGISTNDNSFAVRLTHSWHQEINFSPSAQFLDVSETLQFSSPDRPFNLSDITAICFNLGRVTPAMIDVHAQAFQQMTYQWSLHTNTIPAVSDYQGAAAYMMGMDYYSHVSQFLPVCEQLHKAQVISWYAEGLSRLTPVRLGAQNFMRPSMDMFYNEMAHAGNGTSHPDSGNDPLAGTDDFSAIMDGEIAAQEHSIINGYYQSQNSVSAVVLLRLAQQRATNGVSGIIELNKNNYLAVGATNALGYGPTKLQYYDSVIWSAVTNAFQGWDADYVRAYITPGPVSLQVASYRGMGLVVVGKSQSASLISVNMNGVLGASSLYFADTPAAISTAYSASPSDVFSASSSFDAGSSYGSYYPGGDLYYGDSSFGSSGFDYYWMTPSWYNFNYSYWSYIMPVSQYKITSTLTPPSQVNLSQQINDLYNFPQSTPVVTSLTHALDSGNTGSPVWHNLKNYVYDPVNVMSGEFYHDTVDLTLAGPQLLQLRRNYSSQNQDDRNGFGYGWNINLVPYLGVATTTNATTNIVLTAVELDGSVIAYQQQAGNTNLYLATPSGNRQLDNFGDGHIGSIYNPFNAQIVHSLSGTNEFYTLTAADGQIRTYIVNSFPVSATTSVVSRRRPYLSSWQDTQGNSWTFTYGTNSTLPNYGSITRIQCSNGNYLGLDYNAGGYVIDAYTSDGERTSYQYDDFGDLVLAVRPDESEEIYEYKHIQYSTNGTTYVDSTHLLIKEFKPDGRTLQNVYDTKRRVTTQMATVGTDLNLYTNATFIYSNNFTLSKMASGISGYTLIKDVNGNTNRYDYVNSLITTNVDALGQKIIQNWYADNATAPGYPRSLFQTMDKRGLWTQFQYDGEGNLTNTFSWGDLTGDGTTQYATNLVSYDSNNLPTQVTDPVGNSVRTIYHALYPYLPQYIIYSAGGIPIITNQFVYGNATNVVTNGSLTLTNVALGLLQQQIQAANSSDAATNQWSYDGRGFLTQQIQFTGTGDPAVINNFTCDNQGEVVESVDAAGQRTDFSYDNMRRPISHEVFAAGQGQPMFWEYAYYNANGELTWYDGPRFNPEDYQWQDYDGAGRLTTEIRWRSEAKADGSGMEAPAGYNLYAQSFYQYDKFGNLTLAVDPRGAMTTNKWDPIGQLVQQQHIDTNGSTVLSSEGFAYEPGGLLSYFTNALGGITAISYTTNGLPKYRLNPDGSTNGWRYYVDGRIKREIQSNGAYWQTTYDDANRIVTRIFYSATDVPEATNSIQLDRRGSVIQQIDAGNNVFTKTFDALNRVKTVVGPSSSGNTAQQIITNFFDAAGQVFTNKNKLGESFVARFDAIGRLTQQQILGSSGGLVREMSITYSPDFNGATVTNGSGANAISTTSYTDNDGNSALSLAYPASNANEMAIRQYDLSGNLISEQHDSSVGGAITVWTTANYGYDGLNRLSNKFDRDNAPTINFYNPMGEVTNCILPGGLQWLATYNTAGQLLKSWNTGGTVNARTNTLIYYASGSPFAGLLKTNIDGRGVTCAYIYDDWLRPANINCIGSLAEQNMTTFYQYEPRGFVTSITEQFTNTSVGPATTIQRVFDPYGQLASESISAGSFSYGTSQAWDAAGRRTALVIGSGGYGFGWQADGALVSASDVSGSGAYAYDNSGLLTSRTVGNRFTSIASRDGEGRPLSVTTTVNGASQLNESLSWLGDGLLASHTLVRTDFTDSRNYAYAASSRRLVQEQLNLNSGSTWTNTMVYDKGVSAGLGVLTKLGLAGSSSNAWNGSVDGLSRINLETNNIFQYPAYGHANGPATFNAWLDNQQVPITAVGTQAIQWRATMELNPGSHQLKVGALHPSGLYTAWATNTFTNTVAYQTITNIYDFAGNITNRSWISAGGTINRSQALSWDAHGRLHQIVDRDAGNSGYNWTAIYDALGRRLQTVTMLVTNGVVFSNVPPTTIGSYYDPQVEFLELGVSYGTNTEWKLYGPDLNGAYGGLNGVGGLDAVSPGGSLFNPTISDARGNVLGCYDSALGSVTLNPSRPTGVGAVSGYRPVALANGANVAQASAWQGHWSDVSGYYGIGARTYDPVSGRWLSFDPIWNMADPNGYTFTGGDPINYSDPDGRLGINHIENKIGQAEGAGMFAWDTMKALPHVLYQGSIFAMPEHFRQTVNTVENPVASFQQFQQQIITGYHTTVQSVQNQWQSGAMGQGRIEGYTAALIGSFFVGAGEARTAVGIDQIASKIAVVDARATTGMSAANSTMALTRGTRLTVRVDSADFTAEQIDLIKARYAVANQRIATGSEKAIIGNQVEYVRDLSRRYVRDVLKLYPPNTPISKVRIPAGFNVDEFVSRQFGGRQVSANQNLLPTRINTALGPLEQNAASKLPDGTIIQGIDVDVY